MSNFLTGVYDPKTGTWRTVTKVHSGYDDSTLARLQKDLAPNMEKISKVRRYSMVDTDSTNIV